MNKHDREKMEKKLSRVFGDCWPFWRIIKFAGAEVDRAVRAERKVQRLTENLRREHLRKADERMIEGMRSVGKRKS